MEDLSRYNAEGTRLREAQKAMLDILLEFDRLCKAEGLSYWIDFGTLLGAVRHGGFIPWDDDIDVSMPPKDYRKFLEIGQAALSKGYFLQSEKTDPGCGVGDGMVKIRKDGTLCINDFDNFRKPYHKGLSIDIFEDVAYPSVSPGVFKFFAKHLSKAYGFFHYNKEITFGNAIRALVFPVSYAFFTILWKLICLGRKKDRELTRLNRVLYGYPTLKSDMFPLGDIEFEGHSFPAPHSTDARLRCVFGNYMAIPSEGKRRTHAKFMSTDISKDFSNLK